LGGRFDAAAGRALRAERQRPSPEAVSDTVKLPKPTRQCGWAFFTRFRLRQ
jgi:hypothetical protein